MTEVFLASKTLNTSVAVRVAKLNLLPSIYTTVNQRATLILTTLAMGHAG